MLGNWASLGAAIYFSFLAPVHGSEGAVQPSVQLEGITVSAPEGYLSPRVVGDTLYIHGDIDSHIYDYLARERKSLGHVRVVDLASWGGKSDWSLEIARQIRELGFATRLSAGKICASACVPLFGVGKTRSMHSQSILGWKSAVLGPRYSTFFRGLCFITLENDEEIFTPGLKGCASFLAEWKDRALQATEEALDVIEAAGTSIQLRTDYFAQPDDPQWYEEYNVLRKPRMPLTLSKAQAYNLATEELTSQSTALLE